MHDRRRPDLPLSATRAVRLLAALLVLSTAFVARAEGDASRLQAAAADVERAAAKNDAKTLAALAANKTRPDPFLVTEVLCGRAGKAAHAFAASAGTPDTRGLAAYVRQRLDSPPTAAGFADFIAADAERAAKDWSALSERKPRAGNTIAAIALTLWRGEALLTGGNGAQAAKTLFDAGRRAKRVGWLRGARHAFFQGALASHGVLDYDAMIEAFREVADIEQARGRSGSAAQAVFLRGSVHLELGQYAEALRHLTKARKAFEVAELQEHAARVLNGEALAYLGMGELGRAHIAVQQGLTLVKKTKRRQELLSTQGRALAATGEYTEAAVAYEAALAVARAERNPRRIAEALGNLGFAYTHAGNYDAANEAFVEALASVEKLKHVPSIATALMNLGYLAVRQGAGAEALLLCTRALKLATETKSAWSMASAEQNLAQAHQQLKDYDQALAAFTRSVAHAEAIGARRLLLEGQVGIAECYLAKGKPKEALTAAEAAIKQLRAMVGGLAEGQDAGARAQHAALFEIAAEAAWQLGDAKALARVIENSRAMALLESLEGREKLRRLSIPKAFREEEARERDAVSQARTALQNARARRRPRPEVRKHRSDWRAAESRLEKVVGRIRRAAKHRIGLVYPQPDDMAALKGYLGAKDAFVLYALTPTRYIALVIEKTSERMVSLGSREEIDAACETLVEALAESDMTANDELAALRELAVDKLKLGTKAKRLLISPAGRLFLVPLGAMVGKHTVTYVPSGTTYGVLLDAAAQRGTSVLALGDVDYSGHARLGPLEASRAEAKAVGDTWILGKDASEAVLRKTLKTQARWRALHLACHGLVDTDRPMRTALALVKTPSDDGLLSVLDVFAMQVPADLVALSACESGRGRIYDGEGIVGLTRAFMYAGAPRVVCSLWKVDDKATAALMEQFYKLWNPKKGKGVSAAAALKAAQDYVRKQPKWSAPYYWAAWVLWGVPQ